MGKAENTLRAYRSDWTDFADWCAEYSLQSLPASPETVALYLTARAAGCRPSTLQRRLVAIGQAHNMKGDASPTSDPVVKAVWAGIRREKGVGQRGKAAAVTADIRAMVETLPDTLLGCRDRTLLLLGFAGAFRRSELVALNYEDLDFTEDGVVVTLQRSKTDQEGEGRKVGLALHEAAFAALGGVPRELLYDRMKTVTLGVDDRGEIQWQPLFWDFAAYWGFTPRLCRAYRPQTKGKVERGIRYLRGNFLCGRTATSLSDLRAQLRVWLAEVANLRVHGTTHRVVREAWEEERPHLLSGQGRLPFPYGPETVRRVSRDAFVSYGCNRYAVPWAFARQHVVLRRVGEELQIRAGDEVLVVHAVCAGRHQELTLPDHYAGLPAPTSDRPGGKARITVTVAGPEVEVRSLASYEALASLPVREVAA